MLVVYSEAETAHFHIVITAWGFKEQLQTLHNVYLLRFVVLFHNSNSQNVCVVIFIS